jgi:hypothetical protein
VNNPAEEDSPIDASAAARLTAVEERLSRVESKSEEELAIYSKAMSGYRTRMDEWQNDNKGRGVLRVITVVLLLYIAYRVS